jgi:3-hydroxyacyl-[acyl-carrier-protein] dehydratase
VCSLLDIVFIAQRIAIIDDFVCLRAVRRIVILNIGARSGVARRTIDVNLQDRSIIYSTGVKMNSPPAPSDEVMTLDCQRLMFLLPHRYPFLLVDRVIALVRGRYIHGVKNVTITEPFFQGHLPTRPMMPGVLIIEALAQACGILTLESKRVIPQADSRFYFVGIDKGRFRKPVMPGDQIILKATLLRSLKGILRFETRAEVGGYEVASAQMMISPEPRIGR